MKSTPIFLNDCMYKLRYDLNAVWDIENITDGGFNSIIAREVDFQLCAYLLWSGLKWDNPDLTIQDAEKIIKQEIGWFPWIRHKLFPRRDPVLLKVIAACINELFESGWYNTPKETNPGTVKEPLTVKEIIEQMVKGAIYCGYAGDPWKLTPKEINFFIVTHNEREANVRKEDNFRMGMICASLYNSQRKNASDHVWIWEDFVPNASTEQTSEQMMGIIRMINAGVGGEVK